MSDATVRHDGKFFCNLHDVAELDYTAEPRMLVYTTVRGQTVRLEGNAADSGWAEFIALLTTCLQAPTNR
jgi:hypothetical protein